MFRLHTWQSVSAETRSRLTIQHSCDLQYFHVTIGPSRMARVETIRHSPTLMSWSEARAWQHHLDKLATANLGHAWRHESLSDIRLDTEPAPVRLLRRPRRIHFSRIRRRRLNSKLKGKLRSHRQIDSLDQTDYCDSTRSGQKESQAWIRWCVS